MMEEMEARGIPVQHLIDIGGGRGDLALMIAHSWPQLRVSVVDCNAVSLEQGHAKALTAVLPNLHFVYGDARSESCGAPAQLIVGLHACGGLTDVILERAATGCAAFVVTACCYGKLKELCAASTWGVSDSDKTALCCMADSDNSSVAHRAACLVNSMRLEAAARAVGSTHPGWSLDPKLKMFPHELSQKNFVLWGCIQPARVDKSM